MNSRSVCKYALFGSGAALVGFSVYKILRWCKTQTRHETDPSSIHICSSWAEWKACESIFLYAVKRSKVLGLDCEWVTVKDERHPVALLQLAPSGEICFLIRLCCVPSSEAPKALIKIFEDTKILKVGVNIVGDAQKLFADFGWNVKGCLDLRNIVKNNPEYKDIWNRGLRALAGKVLNVNINKSVEISCSNWEADTLSLDQIYYAAEDATVAFQIFEKLCPVESKKSLLHIPFGNTGYPLKEELREFVDLSYKTVNSGLPDYEGKTVTLRPLSKSKIAKVLATAKKNPPSYDNCFLVAPDGEPLCTCDKGKASWYLEKELGELVREDPFIVRLKFEPSGRPILDNKFYTQERKSGCVVCGNNDHIFRKIVVPHEYRRYFPNLMKKNLSHDVVLLCVTCHRLSNAFDYELRNKLAKECDAPIGYSDGVRQQDAKLGRVKSAAMALLKGKDNIPPERQKILMEIVQEHFGVDEVTEEELKEAVAMNTFITNENYIPHGLKVYEHVCKNGGLIAFESRWRKHFLDTMQPKFLPNMWSIDHNHERLALQVSKRKVDFDISILGISEEMFEKVKNM